MQKCWLLLTFFFLAANAKSQYYYNDVVDLKASNKIHKLLSENNIHTVSANSIGSDHVPTQGFAYSKQLKDNGTLIITHTSLETGGSSVTYDHYANDLLSSSTDSADNVSTNVIYNYDASGNISTIQTQTDDTTMDVHNTEQHKWFYTGEIPDSMIRIKDNADSTFISFKKDENNNITEETWKKKGRTIEHYYYYYNDKNQLTDIVRFNTTAQKMLPDFLFGYNDNGMLSQLTQVPPGSSDYFIWQYIYDERGLKIKDVLFDKHQQLLGTITYTYQ